MIEYVGHAYAGVALGDYQIDLSALTGGIGTAPQTGDIVIIVTAGHWENASEKGYDVGPFASAGYNTLREGFYYNTRALNFKMAWKAWDGNPIVDIHPGTNPGRGTNTDGSATVAGVWRGVDLADPFALVVDDGATGSANIDLPPVDFTLPGSHIVFLGGASAGSGGVAPAYISGMAYGVAMRGVGLGATALVGGVLNEGPVDLPPRSISSDTRTAWAASSVALRPAPTSNTHERSATIAATSGTSASRSITRSRSATVAATSTAAAARSITRQRAASVAAVSGAAAARSITRNRSAVVAAVSAMLAKIGTAVTVQRSATIAAVSGVETTARRILQRAATIAGESSAEAARTITLQRGAVIAALSASTAHRALTISRVASVHAVSAATAVPIFGPLVHRYAFPGEMRGGVLIHQPRGGRLIRG